MAYWRTCTIFSGRSAWNGKIRINSIFRTPQEQGLLGNLSARVTSASIIVLRVNTAFIHYSWILIDLPDVFLDFHSTVDVQIHRLALYYNFRVPEHFQCKIIQKAKAFIFHLILWPRWAATTLKLLRVFHACQPLVVVCMCVCVCYLCLHTHAGPLMEEESFTQLSFNIAGCCSNIVGKWYNAIVTGKGQH